MPRACHLKLQTNARMTALMSAPTCSGHQDDPFDFDASVALREARVNTVKGTVPSQITGQEAETKTNTGTKGLQKNHAPANKKSGRNATKCRKSKKTPPSECANSAEAPAMAEPAGKPAAVGGIRTSFITRKAKRPVGCEQPTRQDADPKHPINEDGAHVSQTKRDNKKLPPVSRVISGCPGVISFLPEPCNHQSEEPGSKDGHGLSGKPPACASRRTDIGTEVEESVAKPKKRGRQLPTDLGNNPNPNPPKKRKGGCPAPTKASLSIVSAGSTSDKGGRLQKKQKQKGVDASPQKMKVEDLSAVIFKIEARRRVEAKWKKAERIYGVYCSEDSSSDDTDSKEQPCGLRDFVPVEFRAPSLDLPLAKSNAQPVNNVTRCNRCASVLCAADASHHAKICPVQEGTHPEGVSDRANSRHPPYDSDAGLFDTDGDQEASTIVFRPEGTRDRRVRAGRATPCSSSSNDTQGRRRSVTEKPGNDKSNFVVSQTTPAVANSVPAFGASIGYSTSQAAIGERPTEAYSGSEGSDSMASSDSGFSPSQVAHFEHQLNLTYSHCSPENLYRIPDLMVKYRWYLAQAVRCVREKYGPVPGVPALPRVDHRRRLLQYRADYHLDWAEEDMDRDLTKYVGCEERLFLFLESQVGRQKTPVEQFELEPLCPIKLAAVKRILLDHLPDMVDQGPRLLAQAGPFSSQLLRALEEQYLAPKETSPEIEADRQNRLTQFLQEHHPAMLEDVPSLVAEHANDFETFFFRLLNQVAT
ncbi:hypothetical protein DIPPA_19754 [Diplonema papillatum]|nr:hypothetical protein DIPPA_19754 [Diplonema papillatum]